MPSSATRSSTAPCQSRTARSAARGKSGEDRARSRGLSATSCRPAAWACQDASARSAAASASSRSSDSSPDSTATLRLRHLGRLAAEYRDHPVPQPADLLLERPEELPGSDELVPAGQHLPAQQSSVGGLDGDRAHGLGVGLVRLGPQLRDDLDLLLHRPGQLRTFADQRTDGPVQGLVHHPGPTGPVRGQRRQPAPDRLHGCDGQQSLGIHGGLRYREQHRVAQPALVHHLAQVRRDVRDRPRRHPVQHHRDRCAALGGGDQVVPGHGVGVAGGRGDEQPEIGGGQQLGGELPVLHHHGVDVRSVEQGQTRWHGLVDHAAVATASPVHSPWSGPARAVSGRR